MRSCPGPLACAALRGALHGLRADELAQYLIGGIIIVESVFNYPGIGLFLVNAVSSRDVPVVETVAVVLAAAYIFINLAADVLVVLLVPSLRTRS